jgi:hypothetical protein
MQLLCSDGENSLTTALFFIPVQERIRLVEDRMLAALMGTTLILELALEHLLSSGGKRVVRRWLCSLGACWRPIQKADYVSCAIGFCIQPHWFTMI